MLFALCDLSRVAGPWVSEGFSCARLPSPCRSTVITDAHCCAPSYSSPWDSVLGPHFIHQAITTAHVAVLAYARPVVSRLSKGTPFLCHLLLCLHKKSWPQLRGFSETAVLPFADPTLCYYHTFMVSLHVREPTAFMHSFSELFFSRSFHVIF